MNFFLRDYVVRNTLRLIKLRNTNKTECLISGNTSKYWLGLRSVTANSERCIATAQYFWGTHANWSFLMFSIKSQKTKPFQYLVTFHLHISLMQVFITFTNVAQSSKQKSISFILCSVKLTNLFNLNRTGFLAEEKNITFWNSQTICLNMYKCRN